MNRSSALLFGLLAAMIALIGSPGLTQETRDQPAASPEIAELIERLGVAESNVRFEAILKERGLQRNSMTALEAVNLMTQYRDDFFGTVYEFGKFLNLQILYNIVREAPDEDKSQIEAKLVELFKVVKPVSGKPEEWMKNGGWGVAGVGIRGGGLGIIIESLLEISDAELITKLFDFAILEKDIAKLETMLNRIQAQKEIEKYKDLIQAKREEVDDDRIEDLLGTYILPEGRE